VKKGWEVPFRHSREHDGITQANLKLASEIPKLLGRLKGSSDHFGVYGDTQSVLAEQTILGV
jgi:hypothetical protein